MDQNILQVGVITSTHGLKGEVKVFPTTDDVKRFEKLKTVLMIQGETKKQLTVERVKYFKQFVILKFKEFSDINEVVGYQKAGLYVTREEAIPCEKDEYYIADLIGIKVFLEDQSYFGELTDVLLTGANDVYDIEREDNSHVYVPAISDCILSVDIEKREMVIHLLDGLID